MAVVVPILMAATGASAAIGAAVGVSALAVTVGTSLVLAATGVNSKIDQAASKVFGSDLVTVGNLAGAAFLAFGDGGLSLGEAGAQSATDAATQSAQSAFRTSELAADAGGAVSGSAASAAGAADAAGTVSQVSTGALPSAGAAPTPTGTTGATTMPGATPMPSSTPNVVNMPTAGAAGTPSTPGTSGAPGTTSPGGAAAWWKSLNPTTQANLMQVGGQAVAGGLGAYMQQRAQQDMQERQQAWEAQFRSGSGLTSYAPGALFNWKNRG